jgi:hypothetical protein
MEKDEGRKSGVVVRLAANGFHSADCLEVLCPSMSFFLLLLSTRNHSAGEIQPLRLFSVYFLLGLRNENFSVSLR